MQHDTRVCVADPENSAFFDAWVTGDPNVSCEQGSRIEGIGRPRMEPSFIPSAVDRMMKVPDAASIAALRVLETAMGRTAGGSTGTGLWSAFQIIAEMLAAGAQGSVVVLAVARGDARIELSADALAEMATSRARIDALAAESRPVYGVSTGFGSLAVRHISPELRTRLQRSLIRSHAAGMGPAVEREVVRALMFLRLKTLASGRTGVRPIVAQTMADVLDFLAARRCVLHMPNAE